MSGLPGARRAFDGHLGPNCRRGFGYRGTCPFPRAGREYRVLYVAKFAETVYVLHAFDKKTRRTPKRDIDLAAKRYRQLMAERRAK